MKLVGKCNLCGACCLGKDGSRCEHLQIFSAVGMPYATMCGKYSERYNGMPITMIDKNGARLDKPYYCSLNSPAETRVIIEQGIKKGVCSMRLE